MGIISIPLSIQAETRRTPGSEIKGVPASEIKAAVWFDRILLITCSILFFSLKAFKENIINVLVATDVAARGLDVADITHVINYDKPNNYEDYVHRIGRTGRANAKGYSLTFVEARY